MQKIQAFLETIFPLNLAEDWDNVGLLIGDSQKTVRNIMTCLTITPEVVHEAVEMKADMIVSHHPFPFHCFKRLTSETVDGRMFLDLIRAQIAVYSPHTAHDTAETGINQQLAEMLNLQNIEPLNPNGSGRFGTLPQPVTLPELLEKVQTGLNIATLPYVDSGVNSGKAYISKVAIGCGAAGEFLAAALLKSADVLLIGETRFHTYLEAKSNGVSLILPGHYASERFAMERLAQRIAAEFPDRQCWVSTAEKDPLEFYR